MTTALAWLARPVSLLGLAVLLLNDHMLKQQWPGLITGKLSDVAGMLMFPPLLAVLVSLAAPRIRPGHLAVSSLLATAAGFSMVKSFPPVAALVSTDLIGPSLVRADLTDLVALPALWLSWRSFTHARPVAQRTARLIRAAILVPAGLLATMATSADRTAKPFTVDVAAVDGLVWLTEIDEDGERVYLSSEDHGLTFTVDHPSSLRRGGRQDCVGQACCQAVPGELHVRRSVDGGKTWATAWRIHDGQYRDLLSWYRPRDPAADLSSRSIAVLTTPDGHVVLVANGRDGLLRRDEAGRWTRLGIFRDGPRQPPRPLSQGALPGGGLPFATAAVVITLLIAALWAMATRAESGLRWIVWLCAGGAVAVAGCLGVLVRGDADPPFVTALIAVGSLGTVGAAGWLMARYHRLGAVAWLWAAPLACVIGAAAYLVNGIRLGADGLFMSDLLRSFLSGVVVIVAGALAALCGLGLGRPPGSAQRKALVSDRQPP